MKNVIILIGIFAVLLCFNSCGNISLAPSSPYQDYGIQYRSSEKQKRIAEEQRRLDSIQNAKKIADAIARARSDSIQKAKQIADVIFSKRMDSIEKAEQKAEQARLDSIQNAKQARIDSLKRILSLEYVGSLQEHERKIKSVLTSLYDMEPFYRFAYNNFPLISSYHKRIHPLIDKFLSTHATVKAIARMKDGRNLYSYKLPNGFCLFKDNVYGAALGDTYSAIDEIAETYTYVLTCYWCNIPIKAFEKIKEELNDVNFAKLVLQATKVGVKQAATSNGLYDAELAKRLQRAVLYNNLQGYLKSSDVAYKAAYIADVYGALTGGIYYRQVGGFEG